MTAIGLANNAFVSSFFGTAASLFIVSMLYLTSILELANVLEKSVFYAPKDKLYVCMAYAMYLRYQFRIFFIDSAYPNITIKEIRGLCIFLIFALAFMGVFILDIIPLPIQSLEMFVFSLFGLGLGLCIISFSTPERRKITYNGFFSTMIDVGLLVFLAYLMGLQDGGTLEHYPIKFMISFVWFIVFCEFITIFRKPTKDKFKALLLLGG